MWVRSQLLLVISLLLLWIGGSDQQEGVAFRNRFAKSLRNTFPFNRQQQQHHHHNHHHEQGHHHVDSLSSRSSRQGAAAAENEVPLDIGSIAAAGERCIDKVVMVQETEYDDVITCKHSYTERCHTTYKTDYEPQQEEECEENYKKRCYIEFKNVASQERVEFCHTPLVRNCDLPGPTECTTEYKSQCETRYHEHEVEEDRPVCREEQEQKCQQVTQGYSTSEECTKWPVMKCTLEKQTVKKYTPETQCEKKPFQLCGPSACPVEQGPEECFDKSETVVQEVPEEQCTLEPQKECKQVTKLVPLLKPAEECVDIPKEVCVRSRTNPRKVSKPVVKKWCYTPKEDSDAPPPPPPPPRPTTTRRPINDPVIPDGNQGGARPGYETAPPVDSGCLAGRAVDYCPTRSANGVCDQECNTLACGYDGGDCRGPSTTPAPSCAPGYPATHCPSLARNGICNPECNTNACGLDGGDCVVEPPTNGYLPPGGGYAGKK